MIKFEMVGRKPARYNVEFEGRTGSVFQTGEATRRMRWAMEHEGQNPQFFPSRRAAFHFFETGEKFVTKAVFAARGKSQRRIR